MEVFLPDECIPMFQGRCRIHCLLRSSAGFLPSCKSAPGPDRLAALAPDRALLRFPFHGLQNEWGDQQLFRIALGTDPPVQLHSFPKSSLLNLKVFPGNAHFICRGGSGRYRSEDYAGIPWTGENQPFGFSGLFQGELPGIWYSGC